MTDAMPKTRNREKNGSAQHVKAQKASVAEKRIERGGVMLPRATIVPDANLRPGSARCQCGRCGLLFSALSNFDAHQTLDADGNVRCWEPASIGMVCRDGVWGRPGDPSRFDAALSGRSGS